MEYVEPIRNKEKLRAMSLYLKGKKERDYVLFIMGINSALRISDLLLLRVDDVKRKTRISIREKKTGKVKDFPLNSACKHVLKSYVKDMPDGSPLFPSAKGGAISRIQAYRILNAAARAVGIEGKIGTHTLRKTFAYWAYQENHDILLLQKILNHSMPDITMRYIGITQDDIDTVYKNVKLGI